METPKYILLKRITTQVENDYEKDTLSLSDLEAIILDDPSLYWGEDPRGSIPVKNSDGTVTLLSQYKGFSFTPTPGINEFFICYEFYDGICVHTESRKDVCDKCSELAEALKAVAIPTY